MGGWPGWIIEKGHPVDGHSEARLAPPTETILLLHLSAILLSNTADGKQQEGDAQKCDRFHCGTSNGREPQKRRCVTVPNLSFAILGGFAVN